MKTPVIDNNLDPEWNEVKSSLLLGDACSIVRIKCELIYGLIQGIGLCQCPLMNLLYGTGFLAILVLVGLGYNGKAPPPHCVTALKLCNLNLSSPHI